MNKDIPRNHISLALAYETLGRSFDKPRCSVINATAVEVPNTALGGPASACSQKVIQEVNTSKNEGRKNVSK